MNILAITLTVLLIAATSAGPADMLQAFELMRASRNVDATISAFQAGSDDLQPLCVHSTDNCKSILDNLQLLKTTLKHKQSHSIPFVILLLSDVKCITVPDDIDDTIFVIHPVVPSSLTLGALKGTPDYDIGRGMIQAFRDSVPECVDNPGNWGIAKYMWISQDQSSNVSDNEHESYLIRTMVCS